MTLEEVMQQLEGMGSEQTKTVLMRHGAREPFFGVKVGDLKKIVKKVKKDQELAFELYATGNSDAMYLAGLISEPKKMTKAQIQDWAEKAYWYMLSEYTLAWVAAESNHGWELAKEWIASENERLASCGWATFSSVLAVTADDQLNMKEVDELLDYAEKNIHNSTNRVRYTMNGFIISAGCHVYPLFEKSKKVAAKIGKVQVRMGGTSCKVPLALQYIEKVEKMNKVGNKRKTAFC
ncbi:MAG: DNA alkylation repair protein [Bacteroidales bacterium]|nr:DNA alkylation repair protein [Bacteroidales bacterium]